LGATEKIMRLGVLLVGSLVLGVAQQAGAAIAIESEHADIAVEYTSAFRLYWSDKDNGVQHAAGGAFARGGLQSAMAWPTGAEWAFFGVAPGATVFVLPQAQDPSLPFLGMGAEGVAPGTFSGPVEVRLVGVSGPGAFALYQSDAFGSPVVRMNSADGLSASDRVLMSAGSHDHYNWAFERAGEYQLNLQASATLPGGTIVQSDPTLFRFVIVPEPALLTAIVPMAGVLVRRRR
jgi:surface-anchored protein